MGLTVEPSGSYFKIVETPEAINLPLYPDGRTVPNNDRYVTQLIRVKGGNVGDISDVANKLKSKQGKVESVGNLLIVTDRGSVVRRILKIVDELDQFGGSGEKIFFYQLQYADAEEVAGIIREIFGEGTAKAAPKKPAKGKKKGAKASSPTQLQFSRVIVDERTGSLIIVASAGDYSTILRLIQQLDVRLPGGSGRIHVKKLRNADPKEVATVLQNLAAGAKTKGGGDKKGNKTATAGGEAAELFSGDVKITADEATRSLVILASAADFKALESVIDELDAERKQVYLELYLLEATVRRGNTAGVGGHGAFNFDVNGQQGVGLVSSAPSPDVSSLVLAPEALSGLAAGAFGPLLPGSGQFLGLGQDIPAFGVIIQAVQNLDDVNMVAEPHVYTADNQEAQLEVGRRVPTQGALTFGGGQGGTSLTPMQSINREDVTLNIKITPHVNDSKTVTLDVELEDRGIVSQDPILGVTTTKRRFKLDNILARDDQPVVLGGLIRETEGINTQQVPGLGSIPLLGWLFKRREKVKEKVNLLVIMVPHIVDTPDEIRRIHERRTRERMEFLERESNFKKRELETHVNYRNKSGLLATIDREARRLEGQELLLREAEAELSQDRITGEIGVSLRSEGGDAEDGGSTESSTTTTEARPKPSRAKSKPKGGG
jgi:general secretion pathway protein D